MMSESAAIVKRPFPPAWLAVLSSARLSYLATASLEGGGGGGAVAAVPHLSLMCVSFFEDAALGAVFIFSTRRDTRKFENLVANPRVAILCHDFAAVAAGAASAEGGGGGGGGADARLRGTLSITCLGTVQVLAGEEEARLRAEHLRRQPAHYAHFIDGEHIAVCAVAPDTAQAVGESDRVERLGPFGAP